MLHDLQMLADRLVLIVREGVEQKRFEFTVQHFAQLASFA